VRPCRTKQHQILGARDEALGRLRRDLDLELLAEDRRDLGGGVVTVERAQHGGLQRVVLEVRATDPIADDHDVVAIDDLVEVFEVVADLGGAQCHG
jgi:hypothetical protein